MASSFDTNDEGWTLSGTGTLTYQSSGGNPTGFLQVTDGGGDNALLVAPSLFSGDLLAFNSGTLSFDGKLITNPNPSYAGYGTVTMTGSLTSASLDIAPPNEPDTQWTTYSIPLDAATWGLSQNDWTSLLSDVIEITVEMEAGQGGGEVVGFDNFVLFRPISADSNCNDIPDECEPMILNGSFEDAGGSLNNWSQTGGIGWSLDGDFPLPGSAKEGDHWASVSHSGGFPISDSLYQTMNVTATVPISVSAFFDLDGSDGTATAEFILRDGGIGGTILDSVLFDQPPGASAWTGVTVGGTPSGSTATFEIKFSQPTFTWSANGLNVDDITVVPLDTDGDTIVDGCDNCPNDLNPGQENSDTDSHGDACDNCPNDDNEDQADGDTDGVGDACEQPVLTGAVSRKAHTGAGDRDIDVGFGDIECRSAQVGTANPNELLIVATFDIDVGLLGGTDVTSDVGTASVAPGSAANELEITITDLPFNTQVNLTFGGVTNATNIDPAYASASTLCVRVVVGDYGNDGTTNYSDFGNVRAAGYLNQSVSDDLTARADFDCGGRPNFLDFAKVKNAGLIDQTAPACPAPPIGP